jgi:hypothetical protein
LANYLRSYRRLAEEASVVEAFALPCLERFSEDDRRLTRLCRELTTHAQWPLPPPLVSALSTQYYWTYAPYNVVGVPAAESRTLLGLPDLCHELAHHLHLRFEKELQGDFADEVVVYFDGEKRRVALLQRPASIEADLERLMARWLDSWMAEFVSDIVATYLVGPAYCGQHIRLSAGRESSGVFYPSLGEDAQHPAEDARFRVMATTIELLGDQDEAAALRALWQKYKAVGGEAPPADYEASYPGPLLDLLARRVIEGCRALSVRAFVDMSDSPTDIPHLLIDAWHRFRTDPESYPDWERSRIAELWSALSV